MLILGIESSCDECACAIVKDGKKILSDVIATQIIQHLPYMGVVPELASRLHAELILPVVKESFKRAGVKKEDIDAVAVTSSPGLLGSLLVGVSFAKSFAYAIGRPLIGVNHIWAHLNAARIESEIEFPYLGLLASGGHTLLAEINSPLDIKIIGASIDDAIGEAFDKVAKAYNFGYPGGPAIEKLAKGGDEGAYSFPARVLKKPHSPLDFSYSGLKNAVINQKDYFYNTGKDKSDASLAASFQRAAVKIIMNSLIKAVETTGAKRIVAGGGVIANQYLREKISEYCKKMGKTVFFPSMRYCTDNAVMVSALAEEYYKKGLFSPFSMECLSREKSFKHFNQ